MTVDAKPRDAGKYIEDHAQLEAEDIEDAEDEGLNEEAPGTGKFFDDHSSPYLILQFPGEGKKKKKKRKPKKKKPEQSEPPRVGLSRFFPDGIYPEGEIQPYKDEYVSL